MFWDFLGRGARLCILQEVRIISGYVDNITSRHSTDELGSEYGGLLVPATNGRSQSAQSPAGVGKGGAESTAIARTTAYSGTGEGGLKEGSRS